MTPDELRGRLTALFGTDRMETRAAAALRVRRTTVYRWLQGERAIPGPVIAWLDERELNDRLRNRIIKLKADIEFLEPA